MKTSNVIELVRQFNLEKAALEARVKELEVLLKATQGGFEEATHHAMVMADELARRDAQEPIYQILIYGNWCDTDKGEYEASTPSERRKVYAETRPAVLPDKAVIREVFMRNGFTIKDGQTDLKDYVYAAANELLALGCQPQRFVVKLPEIRDCCSSHIRCAVALQRFEEAIKAANGEIAE